MDSERGQGSRRGPKGFCPSCWRRNRAIFLAGMSRRKCAFCGTRLKPAPVDVLIEYHEREAEAGPGQRKHHLDAIRALKSPPERTESLTRASADLGAEDRVVERGEASTEGVSDA